jgi:hypothetical protein
VVLDSVLLLVAVEHLVKLDRVRPAGNSWERLDAACCDSPCAGSQRRDAPLKPVRRRLAVGIREGEDLALSRLDAAVARGVRTYSRLALEACESKLGDDVRRRAARAVIDYDDFVAMPRVRLQGESAKAGMEAVRVFVYRDDD